MYIIHLLNNVLSGFLSKISTSNGNTVLVIEHNMDVSRLLIILLILVQKGGNKGGMIVAKGTPKIVAPCDESYTGQYLKYSISRTNENSRNCS